MKCSIEKRVHYELSIEMALRRTEEIFLAYYETERSLTQGLLCWLCEGLKRFEIVPASRTSWWIKKRLCFLETKISVPSTWRKSVQDSFSVWPGTRFCPWASVNSLRNHRCGLTATGFLQVVEFIRLPILPASLEKNIELNGCVQKHKGKKLSSSFW